MNSLLSNFNIYQNSEIVNSTGNRSQIVSGISIHIEIRDGSFQKSRITLFLLNINKYLKYLFIFHVSFSLFSTSGIGKEGDLS